MSDLTTIVNPADLRLALASGSLERVDLQAVDLPPTDVPRLRMANVRMTGTKLVGLHVGQLDARKVQARGVLLRATRFERAELHNWDVSASQGQELQWPGARLYDCLFTETPLTNANLARAMLVGCEFAMADLNHANLTEALILHSKFTDSRQGGAVLDNANLSGAVLCQVDLRGANLLRANFAGAVLIGVDLRDANLVGVSFRNAVLVDIKTERAEINAQTLSDIQNAGSSLADVFDRLKNLTAEQAAMIAATVLTRGGGISAQQTGMAGGAPSQQVDAMAILMRQSFAGMVRELQGRGGPPELGSLRVDGEHVYAKGVTGDEVRLTAANRDASRQAAPMRTPDPGQAAPPAAARPAPAAVPGTTAAPPTGRFSGLEID